MTHRPSNDNIYMLFTLFYNLGMMDKRKFHMKYGTRPMDGAQTQEHPMGVMMRQHQQQGMDSR